MTLSEIRRQACLISAPLLGVTCAGGAWLVNSQPHYHWEVILFIGCSLGFFLAGLIAWQLRNYVNVATGLIILSLGLVLESRIITLFLGPILSNPQQSVFMVLFAHIPLMYLLAYMIFPSRLALRYSLLAWLLFTSTTLLFLVPILADNPEREGGWHLLFWLLVTNPCFIGLMSSLPKLEPALQKLEDREKRSRRRYKELQHIAEHDYLTGLCNRRNFDKLFNAHWAESLETQGCLSLLVIDVDHFKSINDQYGHDTGDQVLKELAARLESEVRQPDILARYGGEEFSVLLPDSDIKSAQSLAKRLLTAVSDSDFCHQGQQLQLTVSIGLASLRPDNSNSPRALLRSADQALYQAKTGGRNQFRSHEDSANGAVNPSASGQAA